MFKKDGLMFNLPTGSYGIGEDGKIYHGQCPDGVEGDNHPAGSGPLSTEEGRAAFGITEEVDPVKPDDTYATVDLLPNGTYTTKPKALAVIAAAKLAAANGKAVALMSQIKSGYSQEEVDTWPGQETEARAWLLNNTAPTPLLDGLCAGRGLAKAALVARIIAKADAFAGIAGTIIGIRQGFEDRVQAALDDEDADAGREALIAIDPQVGWPA